jgi:hypothetical protein
LKKEGDIVGDGITDFGCCSCGDDDGCREGFSVASDRVGDLLIMTELTELVVVKVVLVTISPGITLEEFLVDLELVAGESGDKDGEDNG